MTAVSARPLYRRPASCARALGSLGVVVDSGRRPMNPHGAKETGLRGGDLQTQVAKGWMNGHGRDTARILGTIAEQLRGVAALAGEGITREPFASVQFSAAGLALLVAAQAFRAAAEVTTAGPDGDLSEAEAMSVEMVRLAHELGDYVANLKARFPGGQR